MVNISSKLVQNYHQDKSLGHMPTTAARCCVYQGPFGDRFSREVIVHMMALDYAPSCFCPCLAT